MSTQRKRGRYRKPVPDPTPEEIARMCREIRAEWTESERKRKHWINYDPYTVPSVRDFRKTKSPIKKLS